MTHTIRGLEPRHFHNQRRANAIHEAVNEAIQYGLEIPMVWIEEYNELVHKSSDQSVFSHPVHDVERPNSIAFDSIIHYIEAIGDPVCGVDGDARLSPWRSDVTCLQCKGIISQMENPL